VATVVLWDPAPLGARLALVVLDVALAFFYGAIVLLIYQSLGERKNPKHSDNPTHSRGHQPRPPDAQLTIARRVASELNTTLVRRRDGTCYLRLGPMEGRIPIRNGTVPPGERSPDWVEASTYSWLCMLADTLGAELVYDGGTMEWHLRWEEVREVQGDKDDA
jgi:hypothetical protein